MFYSQEFKDAINKEINSLEVQRCGIDSAIEDLQTIIEMCEQKQQNVEISQQK